MKEFFLKTVALLLAASIMLVSCENSVEDVKPKDYEKIVFKSDDNQWFSVDEGRKYLLDFNDLSSNDVVEFDLRNGRSTKSTTKTEFGVKKTEKGELEFFLHKGALTAPIKFYGINGELIKTIEPNSSSIQTKGWGLLVAAVVLCCVELEYSYSEKDGHSFKAGFDCDCLEISL